MTEQEWLVADDPLRMLAFLNPAPHAPKTLSLIVTCCKDVWACLSEDFRRWLQVAESVAAGQCDPERLNDNWEETQFFLAFATYQVDGAYRAVMEIANLDWRQWDRCEAGDKSWKAERRKQAVLVREIFGNPFRLVAIESCWQTATVRQLAETIYTDRTFDRLPVLADALEDAGCSNTEILNHCRQSGVHVRGCWALDLILGKE